MKARTRLLRLQKAIYQDIEKSARTILQPDDGQITQYSRSYYQELKKYEGLSTKQELLQKAHRARILLVGDYHTLSQAQRTVLRLLRNLAPRWKREKRNIYLALEMLRPSHAEATASFLSGDIKEPAFIEKIGFQKTWGFSWENYRKLFDFAKQEEIEIVGITPAIREASLTRRDTYAGKEIAKIFRRDPAAIVVVVMGEFHLSTNHLPKAILKEVGEELPMLIVHQNIDHIYWKLAEELDPHSSGIVRIKPNIFCILNTPPWMKLKSYVQWAEVMAAGEPQPILSEKQFPPRDGGARGESYDEVELSEEIFHILKHLGNFLGLKRAQEDIFRIVGPFDWGFLEELSERRVYEGDQIRFIKRCLSEFESHFIAAPKMIYLSSLSLNHAASQAAILLHSVESESTLDFLSPEYDFYPHVWVEALGFLGSKIVNPQRKCNGYRDLQDMNGHALAMKDLNNQKAIRLAIDHINAERTSRNEIPVNLSYRMPRMVFFKCTKLLGQILGNGLYHALAQNHIHSDDIRLLFQSRFERREARRSYFDWVEQLDAWKVRNFSKKKEL